MYKRKFSRVAALIMMAIALGSSAAWAEDLDLRYLQMLLRPELGWGARRSLSSSDEKIRQALVEILSSYAPRIWFHEKEPYPPSDPLEFIGRSSLYFRGPSGRERKIHPAGTIDPLELAKMGAANHTARPYQTGFALNGSGYFLRYEDPGNGARKLASIDRAPMFWRLGQGAFARALERENRESARKRVMIEYWYHVPYNLATRIGIGNHQGDWEGVSMLIELEENEGKLEHRLIAGFFAEHESGTWRCPKELLRSAEDSHIEAFSAMGTHATYPSPGDHWTGLLTDKTGRGERWDSWENLRPLALEPYYGFSGAWGEPRFFSFMTGPLVPGPGYKSLPRDVSEKDSAKMLANLLSRCSG